MTNLTTSQTELLRLAASADDGVTQAPDDAKLVRSLIKRGFFIAMPQAEGPSRLLITEAGRAALAASETPADEPAPPQAEPETTPAETASEPTEEAPAPEAAAATAMPKGKLGVVIGLLQRPEGAAIAELMAATGWQAHSVRGVMSGAIKKKLGLTVLSEKTGAGRLYRIPAEAGA
jgi:hypothetical protein